MASFKHNALCMLLLALVVISMVVMSNVLSNNNNFQFYVRNVDTEVAQPEELNGPLANMASKLVIDTLRERYLTQPPPPGTPLKLVHPELKDASMGQAAAIRQILKNQRNGFFIECGALDGETRSNSLVFERELNWTGLLIEADPKNFALVVQKQRHVHLSSTCLSTKSYPMTVSFHQAFNVGKISEKGVGFKESNFVDVQCFPLYSYLLAMGRTTVDYFSLDVEGNELEVLENIPFDKVNIRTLSVEYIHGALGKDKLREFMEGKGYTNWGEVTNPQGLANDFIFYKL